MIGALSFEGLRAIIAAESELNLSKPGAPKVVDAWEVTAKDFEEHWAAKRPLEQLLSKLNTDAMAELKALMWLGRGDYEDFADAHAKGQHNSHAEDVAYIAEKSPLATYLAEGAVSIGVKL
jgi:hypothetical protein